MYIDQLIGTIHAPKYNFLIISFFRWRVTFPSQPDPGTNTPPRSTAIAFPSATAADQPAREGTAPPPTIRLQPSAVTDPNRHSFIQNSKCQTVAWKRGDAGGGTGPAQTFSVPSREADRPRLGHLFFFALPPSPSATRRHQRRPRQSLWSLWESVSARCQVWCGSQRGTYNDRPAQHSGPEERPYVRGRSMFGPLTTVPGHHTRQLWCSKLIVLFFLFFVNDFICYGSSRTKQSFFLSDPQEIREPHDHDKCNVNTHLSIIYQ